MTIPIPSSTHSSRTVLVVDDNEAILQMLALALRHDGLLVLTAASTDEAVEICLRDRDAIAVVLLDWHGAPTLVALRTISPGLRCCLMLAPHKRSEADDLIALGAEHIFEKPFPCLRDLADVLRRVMGSASTMPPGTSCSRDPGKPGGEPAGLPADRTGAPGAA